LELGNIFAEGATLLCILDGFFERALRESNG